MKLVTLPLGCLEGGPGPFKYSAQSVVKLLGQDYTFSSEELLLL